MILKRILALLCAAAVLASFDSCGFIVVNDISSRESRGEGEGEEGEGTETARPSTGYVKYTDRTDAKAVSESYLNSLPERDYEGAVFFVATPSKGYFAPDDTETVLSRLAVQRNAEVSEKLNITMLVDEIDGNTMVEQLNQAVASGSFFTDLLLIPFYQVGNFKAHSTLLNIRTAPFFDLDQPFFIEESSQMTSGGYTTYAVAGDATLSPSDFAAVYFNRKILTDAGVDTAALYRSVTEGAWTWDRLLSVCAAVNTLGGYATVSADSVSERVPDLVFKSSGSDYILTGTRRIPVVGYTARTAQSVMNVLEALYADPSARLREAPGAVGDFSEGKTAFHLDYLYAMSWLTNAPADWGLLPLPKGSESDGDYRTLMPGDAQVFAIPKNHTNAEIPAIVLSALCAASDGYMYDAYVDYNMVNVLRDNDAVNMLDLILDTASFDFALAFGNAFPAIADATYRLVRKCAASNNLADEFPSKRVEANQVMRQYFDLSY